MTCAGHSESGRRRVRPGRAAGAAQQAQVDLHGALQGLQALQQQLHEAQAQTGYDYGAEVRANVGPAVVLRCAVLCWHSLGGAGRGRQTFGSRHKGARMQPQPHDDLLGE